MTSNEPTSTLLPEENKQTGLAMLHEEDLDEESGYSHVYLTAVYHDDVEELKTVLKKQFYKVGQKKIPLEQFMQNEDKSFDHELAELNMEEKEDPDAEDLAELGHKTEKKDLFFYALSVAILSATIQIAFIVTIIKEYFHEEHIITADHELITIRILAFLTITLKLWIELGNGRKIVLHGIYQGFLYRNNYKRMLSILMGLIQIFTALSCYFCSSELIVQTETVIDCVKDFSALIILTEIDNWIGDYFLNTSKQMKVYTRDYCCQIYVLKKNEYFRYTLADLVLDGIYLFTFVISIIPLYGSVTFKSTPAS